jgi:hypothetical protein
MPVTVISNQGSEVARIERLRHPGTALPRAVPHFASLNAGYGPSHTSNCTDFIITKLLEQGIQPARKLSGERQDLAGELLLTLAASEPRYSLTREQIEDLKLSIEEADRGQFATDEEMAETWKKFGL